MCIFNSAILMSNIYEDEAGFSFAFRHLCIGL